LKAGQFRLDAPSSHAAIYSRTDNKPGLRCIAFSDGIYEDNLVHLWT
jgi:hypothetical protein